MPATDPQKRKQYKDSMDRYIQREKIYKQVQFMSQANNNLMAEQKVLRN